MNTDGCRFFEGLHGMGTGLKKSSMYLIELMIMRSGLTTVDYSCKEYLLNGGDVARANWTHIDARTIGRYVRFMAFLQKVWEIESRHESLFGDGDLLNLHHQY